jgi:hypothetical protein
VIAASRPPRPAASYVPSSGLDGPILNFNPPSVPIPAANGFPAESSESVPVGEVEIKSAGGQAGMDSDLGTVVCPSSNVYGTWYEAASAHFRFSGIPMTDQGADKLADSLRDQTRKVFRDEILLRQYGCSYLPNGTPATTEGLASGHMALIAVTFPNGTKIRGVTLPERLTRRQR